MANDRRHPGTGVKWGVKLLLIRIGIAGYLLALLVGMGILFGWEWSSVVIGLAVPLLFALGEMPPQE